MTSRAKDVARGTAWAVGTLLGMFLAAAIVTPPLAYAFTRGVPFLFGWWWNFWLNGL